MVACRRGAKIFVRGEICVGRTLTPFRLSGVGPIAHLSPWDGLYRIRWAGSDGLTAESTRTDTVYNKTKVPKFMYK